MSDPNDDMQYITRRELREELAPIHAVLKLIVERMATKEDLARYATKDDLARFATKDDLARFATKDDLARFATKDDLARFATKDDLARFATKDELAACEARLTRHVSDEVARHTNASAEETRALIRALDDKYSDVHPRLERLEAEHARPRTRSASPRRTRRTRR
ncbi:MAG: hypothetical protein AB7L94_14505 [Kofleriaceae bacterium]